MISVKVSGLAALKQLESSMAGARKALEAASKVAQEQTLNLIGEGFKQARDPYGKPWDAPNNLQITGGIRSYTRGKADSGGWEVHSTDEKAIWHHDPQPRPSWGGKSLPQRLQVPTAERGLPPAWAQRIVKVIEKSLMMHLSRMRKAG